VVRRLVTIPGCDKNMPGSVMAMARLNRPSLMVYGGTIKPGHAQGQVRDIISAFQSYGEFLAGVITDEQRIDIVQHACPGRGACGACTRQTRWPWRSRRWACRCRSARRCRPRARQVRGVPRSGAAVRLLLEKDLKPLDILTPKAFENAMTMVMAVGGSTNAVLHLLAIARTAGVPLVLEDFQRQSDRVPLLAD
jgi:dihydroxy-acid dehydratase